MSSFNISASYSKHEHSSEVKPSITNTVNVINKMASDDVVDESKREQSTEPIVPSIPKILPPKNILLNRLVVDENARNTFEKRLLGICLAVLSSNDKVLLNNIIDLSGNIILTMTDLKELITLATGVSEVVITVGEHPLQVGCLKSKKLPIWVPVTKIIVNSQDFYVGYNRIHTMFAEYRITLEKVIL